jgi:hypothetical protein
MKRAANIDLTKHLLSHASLSSNITRFHLRSMELHPKLSILVLSCLEWHAPSMASPRANFEAAVEAGGVWLTSRSSFSVTCLLQDSPIMTGRSFLLSEASPDKPSTP